MPWNSHLPTTSGTCLTESSIISSSVLCASLPIRLCHTARELDDSHCCLGSNALLPLPLTENFPRPLLSPDSAQSHFIIIFIQLQVSTSLKLKIMLDSSHIGFFLASVSSFQKIDVLFLHLLVFSGSWCGQRGTSAVISFCSFFRKPPGLLVGRIRNSTWKKMHASQLVFGRKKMKRGFQPADICSKLNSTQWVFMYTFRKLGEEKKSVAKPWTFTVGQFREYYKTHLVIGTSFTNWQI